MPDIETAAENLGMEHDKFLEKYLRGKKSKEGLKFERIVYPCPFVTESGDCSIYEARPLACRLYPIQTVHGATGVDCPGLREMKEKIDRLAEDLEYTTTNHSIYPDSKLGPDHLLSHMWNRPEEEKWKILKNRFLEISENIHEKNLFLKLNEMVREGVSES